MVGDCSTMVYDFNSSFDAYRQIARCKCKNYLLRDFFLLLRSASSLLSSSSWYTRGRACSSGRISIRYSHSSLEYQNLINVSEQRIFPTSSNSLCGNLEKQIYTKCTPCGVYSFSTVIVYSDSLSLWLFKKGQNHWTSHFVIKTLAQILVQSVPLLIKTSHKYTRRPIIPAIVRMLYRTFPLTGESVKRKYSEQNHTFRKNAVSIVGMRSKYHNNCIPFMILQRM